MYLQILLAVLLGICAGIITGLIPGVHINLISLLLVSLSGYFLGFIGAAVYYISTATGFWNGVLGVLKAIVWPAFLVYEALKFLIG